MRRVFLFVMFAVLAMSTTAFAQPVGTFSIEGRNPAATGGPPAYTGTITITAAGDAFDVVWLVGASRVRVTGRGLFQNGVFAVTYANQQPPGPALVVYVRRGRTWVGRWLMPGTAGVGTETLTPR
jgi:hypothetical protein